MKHILSVIVWTFIGGIVAAAVIFVDRAYILARSGFTLTSVPFPSLILDVMELPKWALLGAVGGAIFGILLKLPAMSRWLWRKEQKPKEIDLIPFKDPDDVIKALRKEKAEQYLAERAKDRKP